MAKKLVVYYSWSNGNTKQIAEQLAKAAGADLAEIDTVQPYTGSYDEVVDQGQREVNAGYKPEIKDMKANCKGAEFAHEMEVQFDSTGGAHLETPEKKIAAWIEAVKKDIQDDGTWAEMVRAGVWYTDDMTVERALIEAPKNFRRCRRLTLKEVADTD